ncbi:DNA polymerase/3'-5' exonuclease PolX [Bacillus sp. B15-48]|uniref:DNA polymerase/3'-5' exonuclease PolX n=1 Tax=Bacillus sp. B15-48 TaxID=1548601 RepID=UPI00193F3672|nr:DNA polymerase/3'-5' exonuclease PolX [Bacillus sp. B15-48]MBM4762499.1 DNA polymerase/3'-5' exonuclease PolX [Bacillus sp. B15-48]
MSANKKDVIQLLETIALYMELRGENSFKVSAFRKAAAALETEDRSLAEIDELTALPGIGKGTAAVIEEYVNDGTSSVLAELQQIVPKGLIQLLKLPGLGGKKISKLHKELGIEDVAALEEACKAGKVRELAGFGKKSEEKILAALANVGTRPERLPIAYMLSVTEMIETQLETFTSVETFSRAGSLRRMRETIKDLDYILAVNDANEVKKQLEALPNIKEMIASGETKVSLILALDYDVNVDFRLVKREEFTTALHHFTGSKGHNVRMRQLAKERGEKISEYGVEKTDSGEILTFDSEEAFYSHFDLPFIPPELREDGTEVDNYNENLNLISLHKIKGDLHMHSAWSDGAYSLEEMAEACRARGYQYMAMTDHSQFLKVANGLTPERIRKQIAEIRKLNAKYEDFTILTGIEMDILPDGTLDYDDELLAELDVVIASIHSSFSQPREKIMERLKAALINQHVDIIAHPTGRLIGRREGYDLDIDELIQLAKETNTALELNANPHRLDLTASHLRMAQEAGVKIVINTDAHKIDTLSHMEIGVSTARKGWIKESTVLNTLNVNELLHFLHQRHI